MGPLTLIIVLGSILIYGSAVESFVYDESYVDTSGCCLQFFEFFHYYTFIKLIKCSLQNSKITHFSQNTHHMLMVQINNSGRHLN